MRIGKAGRAGWLIMGLLALQGCGGGGGGGDSGASPAPAPGGTPAPAPAPVSVATASIAGPADAKLAWNLSTALQVTLKDPAGNAVSSPLSCSSNSAALAVAADCSRATGLRLGAQSLQVTGGGYTAMANVTVIPPRQPIGAMGGSANASGTQAVNVVNSAGNVLAWGSNTYAGLGQGQVPPALASSALPVAVKDQNGTGLLSGIVANSIGDAAVLALTEGGQVWSWGDPNGGNALGRRGTAGLASLPALVRNPADSGPLTNIASVSSASGNVTALADDGTVYAWGNYRGQGDLSSGVLPVQVRGIGGSGVLGSVVALSAGWNWTAALTADGRVVTWGWNGERQLGQGASASVVDTPGLVLREADGAPLTDIVAISAGYNFGLGLTSTGTLYAWGNNANGQLGQGTSTSGTGRAVLVKSADGTMPLSNVRMAVAGGHHALVLDTGGAVWSWGYAQNGELGDGANHPRVNQSALPAPVVSNAGIGQLSGIAAVGTGYASSFALTGDGQLLAWGMGLGGQLGQGASTGTANSFLPLFVKAASGTGTLNLGNIGYWSNLTRRVR